MIIYIIQLIMVLLAILDRVLCYRKRRNNIKNHIKVIIFLIRFLFAFTVFVMGYLITDTNIGLVYALLTIGVYYMLSIDIHRLKETMLTKLVIILGIPLSVFLFINASQHILVNPYTIMFSLIITAGILSFPNKEKRSVSGYISIAIGIGIALAILFFNIYQSEQLFDSKQELVAKKFLEKELNLYVSTISTEHKLRGEETTVIAYSSLKNSRIIMIYKNNSIINYKIEDLN